MKPVPVTTLDELVEGGAVQLTRGKIISKRDIAACPGNFPIYSSAKDNDGKFGEYGKSMFDEELITWSVDGGGRLFHRPKHKFSVTNVGGVLRIRDTSTLNYRYLYFVLTLRHSEINFDWVRKAHPSVIKRLYKAIPLPPLAEQQRLVGLLDEALEGLATAKANAEKNLKNARAIFQSHLQSVFTQRGPGWVETTIGEVADVFDGPHATPKTVDAGPVFLGISALQDGKINLGETRHVTAEDFRHWTRRVKPRSDDVVFSYETRLGQAAIIPSGLECCLGWRMGLVRPNRKRLDPRFFVYQYTSPPFRSFLDSRTVRGATVDRIALKEFPSFPISLPKLDEQERMADQFETLQEETQLLARLYESKLTALEALKKSLLHQAFTGAL